MKETPIVFSAAGARTVGILTQPDGGSARRPEVGFVFVHGGARGRLSNTFAYPFMARALANAGYPSLRFDPPGLGDAAGEIDICDVRVIYERVVMGDFVDSTLAAITEFTNRVNPKRLVLLGICGGAATAQLTAPRCPRVDGLVLIASPVAVQSTKGPRLIETSGYAARTLAERYSTRVFSPEAWGRLLTGKSDWRAILKHSSTVLFGADSPTDKLRRAIARKLRPASAKPAASDEVDLSAPYPGFIASLSSFVDRGGRALFVYGSNDYFTMQFEKDFRAKHWHKNPRFERNCEVHTIPDANHMISLREWQRESVRKTLEWVATLPGVRRAASAEELRA